MFNNKNFRYAEFKRLYEIGDGKPEFIIVFDYTKTEYVITKYANFVDFSRCSSDHSKPPKILTFENLDELFEAELLDGINLKRDWLNIKRIYTLFGDATFKMYCEYYGIEYKGELTRE